MKDRAAQKRLIGPWGGVKVPRNSALFLPHLGTSHCLTVTNLPGNPTEDCDKGHLDYLLFAGGLTPKSELGERT